MHIRINPDDVRSDPAAHLQHLVAAPADTDVDTAHAHRVLLRQYGRIQAIRHEAHDLDTAGLAYATTAYSHVRSQVRAVLDAELGAEFDQLFPTTNPTSAIDLRVAACAHSNWLGQVLADQATLLESEQRMHAMVSDLLDRQPDATAAATPVPAGMYL
jgi:hypothetical protein